ncbi:signal transduction histidine kinase [Pseudobacter ginsenosidimutans]|uniref:histidine kinase n=2 Tax=Pseudobacter ginsenosidimutans TaxID=661488 RepID=A0A4V2F1M1_9BACT|nr:sensor histidine kinase [Pseudobacter ginsenosidimutans]RZS74256.1 signal transduction histidine kinase [Pseudobacter ginsenosidimutans]
MHGIYYFTGMKRSFILLALALLSGIGLQAQSLNKDSLLLQLGSQSEDSNKAKTLYHLSMIYEKSDLDSASLYLEKLRSLSQQLNYLRGQYLYYERKTVVSFTNGDFTLAMEEARKGLELAKQMNNAGFEIVMLNNIAICYEYTGKFQEQLDYTLRVKKKIEDTKDSAKMSGLYHGLSNVYSNLGQNRKSVDCALFSIELYEKYKKTNHYINRVYAGLGQSYEALGITDSAEIAYSKGITESIRLNDRFAEGTLYKFVTHLYAALGKYNEMLDMANRGLRLAKELKSRHLEASALYNIAAASFYNNQNATAKQYIHQAIRIAEEDSLRANLQDSYKLLSYIEAKNGNHQSAAFAIGKADSLQQASLNEEVANSAADLEKKYETEKKEAQIALQAASIKQKNIINYILIGSAIGLLVIIILIYLNYRNKQQLQQQRIGELETEKQLLATQSLLKGQEDERSRLAKDLHDGLGGLLSGVKLQLGAMKGNVILTEENSRSFNNALSKLDESISEMRRVAHNMMPEALINLGLQQALQDYCDGLSESQSFQINGEFHGLEQRMHPSEEVVVYRIVQELLNNAVKHSGATVILAQVMRQENKLTITVEDNGKGFNKEQLNFYDSAGFRNIQSRVNYLRGQIDIQSVPGKGTAIYIECIIENNG